MKSEYNVDFLVKEYNFYKNRAIESFNKNKKMKLVRISYNNFDKLEIILRDVLIEKTLNDYPLGEYKQVLGKGEYPNITYIG